jgi:hypothetical protein
MLLLLFTCASRSKAQEINDPGLSSVTHEVVDNELQLMQMSTRLKLQTAPQSQWRERRWFFYSVTNQTLTVAGALMNGIGRFYYADHTRRAPKIFLSMHHGCE